LRMFCCTRKGLLDGLIPRTTEFYLACVFVCFVCVSLSVIRCTHYIYNEKEEEDQLQMLLYRLSFSLR
jgi:hypothetical protein